MNDPWKCNGCGAVTRDIESVSSLYCPGGGDFILLCEVCYQKEEDAMVEHGGNDIPELLDTYKF